MAFSTILDQPSRRINWNQAMRNSGKTQPPEGHVGDCILRMHDASSRNVMLLKVVEQLRT